MPSISPEALANTLEEVEFSFQPVPFISTNGAHFELYYFLIKTRELALIIHVLNIKPRFLSSISNCLQKPGDILWTPCP